jgi:hypothetical protein
VAFPLALALLACVPESETQKQVRVLEERLRPFPAEDVIAFNLEICNQHVSWMKNADCAIPSHHKHRYAAWLTEAERLQDTWNCLSRARIFLKEARRVAEENPPRIQHGPSVFRVTQRYIDHLELLLGEENFAFGRMPPPVPIWRFQWVD